MDLGPAELARVLVDLVIRDDNLPEPLRLRVAQLEDLVDQHPDLAIAHLEQEASQYAAWAHYTQPRARLMKAVSVDSLWQHYIDDQVKANFPDPEGYRRYLDWLPDAAGQVEQDLKASDALIPAPYSWLAPYADTVDRSAWELIVDLELAPSTRPPLVLLVLRNTGLETLGIGVREPRATDAVPGRQIQWRPTGLDSEIDEFIDRDIPVAAIERVELRI